MRVFKTKWFARWASTEQLSDRALLSAVDEMKQGLIDANLGGYVFKKRVSIKGRGKSAGLRTLLAFRAEDRAYFVFGFAKNERADISDRELRALKVLAGELLRYDARALAKAIDFGELILVIDDE
jgi:hypothetical protein